MQVEKIHDLRKHLASADGDAAAPRWKRIGVISPRRTRVIAFAVISMSLVATAACCLLAVWSYVGPDIAWRALGSFGIIALATSIFVALNEGFGPTIRE